MTKNNNIYYSRKHRRTKTRRRRYVYLEFVLIGVKFQFPNNESKF